MPKHRHQRGDARAACEQEDGAARFVVPHEVPADRAAELDTVAGLEISLTLTRSQPPGWEGYARRIDHELLAEVAWPSADRPLAFVCGPTTFVEVAAGALTRLGYEPASIKTERFGPTGG